MNRAFALGFALSAIGSAVSFGQVIALPAKPTVYNNPQIPDDPRVGLKPGLTDAGEAASGMKLVMNLPKPPGFGVGTTPQELAPRPARPTPAPAPATADGAAAAAAGAGRGGAAGGRAGRPETISFGSDNSDLAFGGNKVFSGNYNGFNVYDVSKPEQAKLAASVMCPGAQDDISVYGHLVFLSVEATGARIDCGTQGIQPPPGYVAPAAPAGGGGRGGRGGRGAGAAGAGAAGAAAPGAAPAAAGAETAAAPGLAPVPPGGAPAGGGGGRGAPSFPSPDRFRGVRIFDISDLAHPKQVAAVQTCRGSHTHTLVTDPKDKDNIYIYVSGYSQIRSSEELAGCSGGGPENPDTALYTIVVIKVPLAHPELSKVVNSPRIFADATTGAMNGLVSGADQHGNGGAGRAVSGCHDITAYPALGLAAGACVSTGLLLDITDPVHPKRLAAISDPNFSFWHSASFNNDGTRVIFSDEYGGGDAPRCQATDPMTWGGDSIFTLGKDHSLTLDSYYKMPAPQTSLENCTAHNGSMIPIPGRDIMVQSFYQGGVTVMDYTDPHKPFEIAYFDRGPSDGVKYNEGGYWSSYWYNGYIYGNEISRGLDVFKLLPSKFVTQAEIDASNQIHFDDLNVQSQPKVVYPATFLTAKAYVDQLARSNALTADKATAIDTAMDKKNTKQLKAFAASLEKDAATASPLDAPHMTALAEILKK